MTGSDLYPFNWARYTVASSRAVGSWRLGMLRHKPASISLCCLEFFYIYRLSLILFAMGRSLAGTMASTVFAALDRHPPFYFRLVVLISKAQHFYSMPHTRWQDPVPQNRRPESDPRVSLFEIRCVRPQNLELFWRDTQKTLIFFVS